MDINGGSPFHLTSPLARRGIDQDDLKPESVCKSVMSAPNPIVAVIGIGYVGTELVRAFASRYEVLAYDIDKQHLVEASGDMGHTERVVTYTADPDLLRLAACFVIAVPTLLHEDHKIDFTHLESAVNTIRLVARRGSLVIVESSVAVGATRRLLGPLHAEHGLLVGVSPERVDPGRRDLAFEDIPKVVAGIDTASRKAIKHIYGKIFRRITEVSSLEVAEMTKLYENGQRMVSIAYANEMADACLKLNVDPTEVCRAAATKPFGYTPYTPGLGVGGHCVPVNPYYLLSSGEFPLLRAATETTLKRPSQVGEELVQSLTAAAAAESVSEADGPGGYVPTRSHRVLVIGVGYKAGQSNTDHSPAVELLEYLQSLTGDKQTYVEFLDPIVPQEALRHVPKFDHVDQWNEAVLKARFDCVVLAVAVDGLDLEVLIRLRQQDMDVRSFVSELPWIKPRSKAHPSGHKMH